MPDVERLLFEARRWGRREKFTHALKIYQQVLDLEPKNTEALIGKGGCHYKLGRFDEARSAWEEALRLEPRNRKVREFLDKLERGSNITIPSKSSIKLARDLKSGADKPPPEEPKKAPGSRGGLSIILAAAVAIAALVLGSYVVLNLTGGSETPGETVANRPVIADGTAPADTANP